MMKIDSREIRSVARKLSNASASIRGVASGKLRRIKQESSANLEGLAADALETRITELTQDVTSLANALSQLSAELNLYAARIEFADAQSQSYINQR